MTKIKNKMKSLEYCKDLIDSIFDGVMGAYPAWRHAWRDQEELERAKISWLITIMEAEINDISDINRGMAKCRADRSAFVPSAGQFIAWCIDKDNYDLPLCSLCGSEIGEKS